MDISDYQTMDLLESIVRGLANINSPIDSEYDYCICCDEPSNKHLFTCPWLMAMEWVKEHPDA